MGVSEEKTPRHPMNRFMSLLSIPVLAASLGGPPTSHRTNNSTFREEVDGSERFRRQLPGVPGGRRRVRSRPRGRCADEDGSQHRLHARIVHARGRQREPCSGRRVPRGEKRLPSSSASTAASYGRAPIEVGTTIADRTRIASRLLPSDRRRNRVARVELAPFSWFTDVIYSRARRPDSAA